mgnify:FL=1|jgi:hypothetical protein
MPLEAAHRAGQPFPCRWSWQSRILARAQEQAAFLVIVCPSVPVSISRPVPVLPRSGCGPEPAAVRFKAAFRAALRPDRTDLAMAGPRPARGLRKPCLAANLPCSPSVRPDPEAPVIPPVPVVRARGRAGTEPVRASETEERTCHDQKSCQFPRERPRRSAA